MVNGEAKCLCDEPNKVYELRNSCPTTCFKQNLFGSYDCDLKKPTKGCYCKSGYVLNKHNQCVALENCGCVLPDIYILDVNLKLFKYQSNFNSLKKKYLEW